MRPNDRLLTEYDFWRPGEKRKAVFLCRPAVEIKNRSVTAPTPCSVTYMTANCFLRRKYLPREKLMAAMWVQSYTAWLCVFSDASLRSLSVPVFCITPKGGTSHHQMGQPSRLAHINRSPFLAGAVFFYSQTFPALWAQLWARLSTGNTCDHRRAHVLRLVLKKQSTKDRLSGTFEVSANLVRNSTAPAPSKTSEKLWPRRTGNSDAAASPVNKGGWAHVQLSQGKTAADALACSRSLAGTIDRQSARARKKENEKVETNRKVARWDADCSRVPLACSLLGATMQNKLYTPTHDVQHCTQPPCNAP